MRRLLHRPTGERGAAALLVAALTVVLIGVLAFVTDFGMAYANQRRLQNGVDAAVLAVGQKIATATGTRQTCEQILDSLDQDELREFAVEFLEQNAPGEGVVLQDGATGFRVECTALGDTGAEQLVVSALGAQPSPTFFGGVLGADGIALREDARAVVGVGIPRGLRPFAICGQDAEELLSGNGQPLTLTFVKGEEDCGGGSTSGNWGLLDFDGTGGGRGSGKDCDSDSAMLECWIKEGYAGALPDPSIVNAQTGSFGGLGDDMSAILGQDIPLPVYSSVSGKGNNAKYVVTGYIFVEICAYDFQGASDKSSGESSCADASWNDRSNGVEEPAPEADPLLPWIAKFEAGQWTQQDTWDVLTWARANTKPSDPWHQWLVALDRGWTYRDTHDFFAWLPEFITDREAAANQPPSPRGGGNANYLQLRFVRHLSAGTLDLDCGLGSDCDFGLRVVKLAE
ncbi:Tad domain-containing protein [Nocardioides pakistanensis]